MSNHSLVCRLIDLGFFSALGTTEYPGGGNVGSYVEKGKPFTWDKNNGVTVVYDERGWPWIGRSLEPPLQGENYYFALTRGAYVPHSNDGGHFIQEVLPTLL
ncbi:MAG: hypothetical protein WC435_01855 [Candidatus Paceibacterota bacterium]